MKGFFGTQGNYYEADEPMSPSDTEVPLRPSEAYILSPQGKWVLDRRVVNIAPPAPSMGQLPPPMHPYQNQPHQPHPTHPDYHPHAQMPSYGHTGQTSGSTGNATDVTSSAKYAVFDWLTKHWMAIISAAVWAAGTYATLSRTIYDMQAQINQQNAAIQMVKDENTRLRAEAKEQQTTDNARMSTIENRYGDLQLLLQQISANVKK